ncbi:MAG: TlpA family protein disulfide reductase [Marmoricola sp.]
MKRLVLLVLVLTFLAAGCGVGQGGGKDKAASLDFAATTATGKSFEGSSLSGKPTVFWFWAPWCPTCRAQIPEVSGLARQHAGAVNFVGVGSLDGADKIAGFADLVPGNDITELTDPEGTVWKHFGVTAQSTYLVLDARGEQVAKGSLSRDKLAKLVEGLAH